MKIQIDGCSIKVQSREFKAEFDGASLTSFSSIRTGTEFCREENSVFPLEFYFAHGDRKPKASVNEVNTLGEDKHQEVIVKSLSDIAARVILIGNDSDRELLLRLDSETGDLCVRPAGHCSRRGLVSIRWNIAFDQEAALVLPCVNGILVETDREFPKNDRFPWPYRWNAQLVIAERDDCSMMIHSEDNVFKFKALNLSRNEGLTALGFESEQLGPIWDNRAAGGVEWRLNLYEGDWGKPADRYRQWMEEIYDLSSKRQYRPEWVEGIDFCVCWASSDVALLNALAKIHQPEKTLIHLSQWRTSAYDVDYPDYFPTEEAKAYLAKANAMGFKVMPHFNYFACYEKHPFYQKVRDWQIRGASRNDPQGWYWPPPTHDYTRMGYIHPGLSLWRRKLIDTVREACSNLQAPAAFIDQTLCTWNTDNGLVENLNTVEGMRQLQEEFVAIQPDIVIAGEGLNEISFQRECFAQAHVHDGWGELSPHHIDAAHPICSYLWKGHTRLVGYYHLRPTEKDADIGVEVYRRMGAIPTLICNDPQLIQSDQPLIRKLFES